MKRENNIYRFIGLLALTGLIIYYREIWYDGFLGKIVLLTPLLMLFISEWVVHRKQYQ